MAGERTEQATQHRREQARKDGDILHSKELSAAAGTLAGVMVLGMIGSRTLLSWRSTFAAFLALGYLAHWEPSEIQPTLFALRRLSLSILAPVGTVMAVVALAALGIAMLQTGGVNFHVEAVGFKLDRINPISNV